ncbi:hypothetical protein ACP4OV_017293 [Aristida adscensionis]
MQFMLFAGAGGRGDKVVATDLLGRATFYDPDPDARSIRAVSGRASPMFAAVSLTVGDRLYALDTNLAGLRRRGRCFEEFFFTDDWYCRALPPPPYVRAYHPAAEELHDHVGSYAVAGAGGAGGADVWVSRNALGTHAYDTARAAWSKVGDWALPFRGRAWYVPEHGLWFGVEAEADDDDDADGGGGVCASDLAVAPPAALVLWRERTPPECRGQRCYLVHLGRSRFCHARFFVVLDPANGFCARSFVVFTGIEVERRDGDAGGELVAMKHVSKQYSLVGSIHQHWVL